MSHTDQRIFIPDHLRDKHIYVIGTTGSGKSTLIHAMCYQDIMAGRGLCLIDPSGDLIKKLIHWIPKERVEDTILLDTQQPIPIDFLSYQNWDERQILTADIIKIFDAPNAPRMKGILYKLIPTLFEVNENPKTPPDRRATFLDLYRFLMEPKRTKELLQYVSEERREYWRDHFPRPDAIEPIVSRMAPFTESPTLVTVFGSPKAALNIWDVIQSGKILLVSCDIHGIDQIFATILIAKIQQAAFRRRDLPESEREPFCLYVDEFENFQTSAFDVILTQGRKFQLWLTLSHQMVGQLDDRIRIAIFGVSTFIILRTTEDDAPRFRGVLGKECAEGLPRLPNHTAYYVIDRTNLGQRPTPERPPYREESYAELIRKRTVEKYACAPPRISDTEKDDSKGDEIPPSTGPIKDVPPHRDKAKGHRGSR